MPIWRQSYEINQSINQSINSVKTFAGLSNDTEPSKTSSLFGISKQSVGLVGVGLAILCEASFATPCNSVTVSIGSCDSSCLCSDASSVTLSEVAGKTTGSGAVYPSYALQCTNISDTTCGTVINPNDTTETRYFKNTSSGGTSYYKCDWTSFSGFSNPQMYTPSGGIVNAPIDFNFNKPIETFATEIELK